MTRKQLMIGGLGALVLGACGPNSGGTTVVTKTVTVDGSEGIPTGSADEPVYWVAGHCGDSFELKGEGNPVGYSNSYAESEEFRIDYKDIGEFDDPFIIILADEDIGDDYWGGIGTYEMLPGERLTEENNYKFFEEGFHGNCEDSQMCVPICGDDRVWGDVINDKLDQYDGVLIGSDLVDSSSDLVWPYFRMTGSWGVSDACKNSEAYIYSGI